MSLAFASSSAPVGRGGADRCLYDGAHFEKLVASAAQLSEADKVNLASDAWALVQADRQSIPDYFKLVETLREENSLALWEQITAALSIIDFLYLGNSERAAFQAYGRSLLKPVFARVGWEPKKDEEVTTGLLRTKLITELSEFGDEDVIASAVSASRNLSLIQTRCRQICALRFSML